MKVVIAPDSFKESLTALEVANAIELGFSQVFPHAEYVKVPVADGGEGTVQSMIDATGGKRIEVAVRGPLGQKITGFYGLLGDGETAVIEMAAASGLHLVPSELRNPLVTCSYGTGELIVDALNHGVKHIILGLGGSATNDAGLGMVKALGVKMLDLDGQDIGVGGAALARLAKIDVSGLDPRLAQVSVEVACDVDNPLCGEKGASAIFGPQKGATPEVVAQLDANLRHYGGLLRTLLDKDVMDQAGAGAAGGMGAGVLAFLDATLRPGIDIVMEAVNLETAVKEADLVITGEGRIDSQTIHGKTPIGVARVAKRYNKKVIAIAGCLANDCQVVHDHGLDAVFSAVSRPMPLSEALSTGKENLVMTARNIAALLKS